MAIGMSEVKAPDEVQTPDLSAPAEPVIRLRQSKGWRPIRLAELWRYRELLWFLALRDIKVRYKQTVLGRRPGRSSSRCSRWWSSPSSSASWARCRPTAMPYPLFVLAALLPWQLFAYALTQSSNSLVAEQRLITKVYFPRLIVPLASVLSGLVDFVVAFVLLLAMMAWYGMIGCRQ